MNCQTEENPPVAIQETIQPENNIRSLIKAGVDTLFLACLATGRHII